MLSEEMRKQIDEEKANEPIEQKQVAVVEPPKPNTNALIDSAVTQAVVSRIQTDEKVQKKVMDTADIIIDNKMGKAQDDAEKEAKEAHLLNNQDACDLYGIDEKTVPKWVVNIAKKVQDFWYAFWLLVGFFTTAPVVFLSKKIKVICKKTWVAVALALAIYLAVILTPILTAVLN